MLVGKIRSLHVRPIQSADLAFDVPGIIASQGQVSRGGTLLGKEILGLVLENDLYPILLKSHNEDNDCDAIDNAEERMLCIRTKSELRFNADEILQKLGDSILFMLSNGSARAALKQAIIARANAYLEKYYSIRDISSYYLENINDQTGKLSRLKELINIGDQMHSDLQDKYGPSPNVVTDVKTLTKSGIIDGVDVLKDSSTTQVRTRPLATQTLEYATNITANGLIHTTEPTTSVPGTMVPIIPPPEEGKPQTKFEAFTSATDVSQDPTILSELSTTTNSTNQTSIASLVDYQHPSMNASIEHQKMQIELRDELLKNRVHAKKVDHLERILENELTLLSLDVNRLQHEFLKTILVSPINGVVTTVYKDPGDYVTPGEPVLRVENSSELLIVGFIQYRGLLVLKTRIKLTTTLFENFGQREVTLNGEIVSIRGHMSDDDEWDVVIHCKENLSRIPINYHFDKDNTMMEILQ